MLIIFKIKYNLSGEFYFCPSRSHVIYILNFAVQQQREPAGIAQSVRAVQRKNFVRFPARARIFPLLQSIHPVLGPTQLPIQKELGRFAGDKSGRILKLATHIHAPICTRTALLSVLTSRAI
jgi:hypothetical protein